MIYFCIPAHDEAPTIGLVLWKIRRVLEESARECDAALARDPRNRGFRSCAFAFLPLGKYGRAREYFRLDAGSDWAKGREGNILHREGKTEAAAALYAATGFAEAAQLMRKSGTKADRDRVSAVLEAATLADRDPEDKYYVASILASTGYPAGALRVLRNGVEANYLGYPAMDHDPLFESIRNDPEFAAIRAEAIRRQKAFLARRASAPPG